MEVTPINWTLSYRSNENEEWKEIGTTPDISFDITEPLYAESDIEGVGSFTSTLSMNKKDLKRLTRWLKRTMIRIIIKEKIKGIFKRCSI